MGVITKAQPSPFGLIQKLIPEVVLTQVNIKFSHLSQGRLDMGMKSGILEILWCGYLVYDTESNRQKTD